MIKIVEATNKKLLKEFVKFPFELYKNNPYWVPPVISDELKSFDKNENPIFENAEANYYLAYKNNKIVGRIAVIINWDEVEQLGKKKVRFGWIDFIDDIEVSKKLIDTAITKAKQNSMDHIEGPMGFSNLDKVGILTEGFDQKGLAITWYNHAYYKDHFQKLGFQIEKEYQESYFKLKDVNIDPYIKASDLLKRRYEMRVINFKKTKEILPYIDTLFEIFNTTYAKLQSFAPIREKQINYFKKKYIGMVNPDFIKFIEDKNGKLIAFGIVMSDFADALIKSKGKLWPFGFLHLLKARNKPKDGVFYLIGILPEYQNKGLTALLFEEFYKVSKQYNINLLHRSPELEENHSIHNLWKNFKPVINKRRCTFKLTL